MKNPQPKILVVDDERDQRDGVSNYFSKRNFKVISCSNGQEALKLINEEKPDVVLLDLKLEGQLDGKDVLTQLRETDKKTKVIINTGSVLLEDEELTILKNLGISEFLNKPLELKKLEQIIYSLINKPRKNPNGK